jgi:quercetin dioxygenase-like cupin family protein
MSLTYRYIPDLGQEASVQPDGILSRVLHSADGLRTVIFAFDKGQELTEHTASRPAILQVLQGEGRLRLGEDELEARPGTWAYMPAGLLHAVRADSPLVLLLTLLPKGVSA